MRYAGLYLLAAMVIVVAAVSGMRLFAATEVEIAPYEVELRDGDIELRRYPGQVTAVVRAGGTRMQAANTAFMPLFRYISGRERGGADDSSIAMTAPVTQNPSKGGTWAVAFIMPRDRTPDTLPEPAGNVRIEEVPAQRVAAIRFSGRWTDANFARHMRELTDWMDARGLKPAAPATYAYYNGPFTPWFARRNEVLIRLAD